MLHQNKKKTWKIKDLLGMNSTPKMLQTFLVPLDGVFLNCKNELEFQYSQFTLKLPSKV